jgi:prophage tail gpP-like protein
MLDTREKVTIKLGEHGYPAWKQANILLSLERLSGTFDISGSGVWTEDRRLQSRPIKAGLACALAIAGETVITGAVDAAPRFYKGGETGLKVSGRDRTALIADCALEARSWNGATLLAIANDLCGPLGISVRLVNWDGGKAFPKYALDPGEKILATLEDACRQLGVMMWTDGLGNLMIGRPAKGPHVGALKLGKNIIEAEGGDDHTDRFRTYRVVGQRAGGDLWDKAEHAQTGQATDPAIDPRRTLVLAAEGQVDGAASAQQRAEHEARVRKARGNVVTATIKGWRAPNGAILRPGQRMDIDCDRLGAHGTLMLAEVNMTQGTTEGTVSRLKMMPEAAFDVLAEGAKDNGKGKDEVWS